jgi:hypothetical protein
MSTEPRPTTLADIFAKWLPIAVIVVGGIGSFSYAMAQQVQTAEKVNRIELRQDVHSEKVTTLEGDVRVIRANTEWLVRELSKK